jgi:hypothetical protein
VFINLLLFCTRKPRNLVEAGRARRYTNTVRFLF